MIFLKFIPYEVVMNEEMVQLALKKIDELTKRLEKYFDILRIENELDFILKGTYVLQSDIDAIMSGNY